VCFRWLQRELGQHIGFIATSTRKTARWPSNACGTKEEIEEKSDFVRLFLFCRLGTSLKRVQRQFFSLDNPQNQDI
jgi:hypothetical protein